MLSIRLVNPIQRAPSGLASSSHPIPIIVPCHRVISGNFDLTGYGSTFSIKQKLLSPENRQIRLI